MKCSRRLSILGLWEPGREMFEDTDDLAMGVMAGLNRRGTQAGYALKRVNSGQANLKFLTT
jgi:hypothetical protein